MSNVLIVDDEESICWGLARLATEAGHAPITASSAEDALAAVRKRKPDLIFLDVRLPGKDGLSAMAELASLSGALIVVITAFGNLETAVAAVRNGAFDYLTKPFDLEQAAAVMRRALAHAKQKPASVAPVELSADDQIVGISPAMQEVFKRIALVAPSDSSVLITGESGTGKELVARAIHRHSRADRPLVPINLASLSPTLVESELFGHVRAFTGAETSRPGLLELADQATVFFDEAGDIPPSVQVKLLRVLEQHEVTPVGDTRPRPSSFRVIAATNRDLRRDFQQGDFRQDLYFRFAVFEIALPPLRRRAEDIPLLAQRFLNLWTATTGAGAYLTDAAIEELGKRSWPGNVRELRSAVEHGGCWRVAGRLALSICPRRWSFRAAPADLADTLADAVRHWTSREIASGVSQGTLYERFLGRVEPPLFETVLESTAQNRAAAADVLGIHRATLRKKLN